MCSRYIAEREKISLMARELRSLQSLDKRGKASLILILSGFSASDVAEFLDRAIESERNRRLALWGVVEMANAS